MVLSTPDETQHRKPCTLCSTPRDVLIRCQIDDSGKWHLVCPGKCWTDVSGGVVDGDANHPYYRYGGAWKNKFAGVSAKKPKKGKGKGKGKGGSDAIREWVPDDQRYTTNDKVVWEGRAWVCRKSHFSREDETPDKAVGLWKEADEDVSHDPTGEEHTA